MHIKGLQKTTLLDFPGKVACTVFTGGCNFRCPFCHNASLVLSPNEVTDISEEEFFSFLSKRKGILDGVCITGGEPLLQNDIIPFIERIHSMGFAVKLDTNGSFYERLKEIISLKIVDYVAMDIKNSKEKYSETAGIKDTCENIFKSIELIMNSGIDYEFRTTVVKELHSEEDILSIAKSISGAKRYFLQNFRDTDETIVSGYTEHSEEALRKMLEAVRPYVLDCGIRGI